MKLRSSSKRRGFSRFNISVADFDVKELAAGAEVEVRTEREEKLPSVDKKIEKRVNPPKGAQRKLP
jgi:hypothetical protein